MYSKMKYVDNETFHTRLAVVLPEAYEKKSAGAC